jgi:cyclohexa-1,5-dienecarbonyl-CoA hydratase
MVETEAALVRIETLEDGRIWRAVLSAGKGNVIDARVIAELRQLAAAARSEAALRAIVLDHEGPHFSFGASVAEHLPGEVEQMLPNLNALAVELLDAGVPILAAVKGMCLGGGLEVASLCDLVFAAPGARFGQPEVTLAVFAPLGSLLLPRIVGAQAAADLLLSGRAVPADEARAMGLVAEVVEDPGERALAWAREHLLPKSAAALRFATQALRESWRPAFEERLACLERTYLDELMQTADAREGLQAFLEKRTPQWEDR